MGSSNNGEFVQETYALLLLIFQPKVQILCIGLCDTEAQTIHITSEIVLLLIIIMYYFGNVIILCAQMMSRSSCLVHFAHPDCKAVIRNLVYKFMPRLDKYRNTPIIAVLGTDMRWKSRIRRQWVKSLYIHNDLVHIVCMFYVSPGFFFFFFFFLLFCLLSCMTIWAYTCIIICVFVSELKN